MTPDSAAWTRALLALRNPDGGWAYRHGRRSRLEPTCWALLALGTPIDETPVSSWLRDDGLLVEPGAGLVNLAFNGLATLAASAGRPDPHALTRRLTAALLEARGEAVQPSPHIRVDTTLQGWSWTPGTFSWVEPTAWCLLAIKRWPGEPDLTAARIRDGEAVLRDRVCRGGGWNFGNGEVYGRALPAHVPPTGLGVLALQDRGSTPLVQEAVAFLERSAPREGSTMALAIAALALMAVGRAAEVIVERLGARYAEAAAFGNAAALAMAAYALRCAAGGIRPFALPARIEA
jgi:hypothetical protein